MNMDFLKTCRYEDTGQLFLCDKSAVGDFHIMDMRGWGYFGKESDQKAVAEEIARRIREFPDFQAKNINSELDKIGELQEQNTRFREALMTIGKYGDRDMVRIAMEALRDKEKEQ